MADAIWNDRYILSNMTSEKLYAKSPLTTGVSGTSAYIGLEPSATYNETVLFSGEVNATTATANLSEPISSFNRVKMLCKLNRSTPVAAQWFEFTTDTEYYTMLGGLTNDNTTAGKAYMGEAMVSLSGGIIDYYNGKQLEWGSTAVSNNKNASIYQVIGINRKEV